MPSATDLRTLRRRPHGDLKREVMRAVNRLPGVFVFPAGTGSFHVGARFVKMGMQGVSDLIGWKSARAFPESPVARFVALEIKVGRDKLSPLQKAFLDQVKE